MGWTLAIAGVMCGWAMLRVLGGERERRMRDLAIQVAAALEAEAEARAEAEAAAALQRGLAAVRSKVGR